MIKDNKLISNCEKNLKSSFEKAIEPDLPICDTHHHLWHHPESVYSVSIEDHYSLQEFLNDISGGHKIIQTVYAHMGTEYKKHGRNEMRPVGETEFVASITAQCFSDPQTSPKVAAGIVGFADLTLGDAVVPVLEAHINAGAGRFRGVRLSACWDLNESIPSRAPARMLFDTEFRKGFKYLQKYNLSFDTWQYFTQLTDVVDLARTFSDTQIIVNHFGGPLFTGPYSSRREEVLYEWKRGINALAECPNVSIKLGGFGLHYLGFDFYERAVQPNSTEVARAVAPFCLYCIESFGTNRCMLESNYPIDKSAYSYTVLWNAFKIITNHFSHSEKVNLFYNNAVKIYRLTSNIQL